MTEAKHDANEEVKVGEIIDDRMREEEAESLCRWAAARAGVIVVAPLLGTMSLVANEIYLIIKLGKVYGEEISEQAAVSVLGSLGAYFVGSFFGKTKLCPEISPKKTVEGAIGGMVVNMLVLVLIGWIYELLFPADVNYISMLLIGFGSSVISILGDLSFSLIKRSCNIKDFGQVIPGHGGILDRFDSVIFVSPFVYYICLWLPLAVK